jgi:LuxR family maltose regulon positive regulatory protein
LNALDAVPVDTVLALDDYHTITAEPIHRGITFLLEHLPSRLHLLLTTRADPPLPLARLRARGQLTEVRAEDLRFTRQEATAFLTEAMGLALTERDVATLEARTEGWIAGLQLAGLSLRGRAAANATAFIAAFAGSHRHVVDYLVDEVLLRQPGDVQAFLLRTCILDRLCASLCAELVGDEDAPTVGAAASQAMLESLEQANLFVIPLDEERRWYRYHHLFADALRQRLASGATRAEVLLLHARASVWLEQHRLLPEAINHALKADQFDRAARLMEQTAWALYGRGGLQTLRAWMATLPEHMLRSRPRLCVVQAWAVLDSHDDRHHVEQAERHLRDAEQALSDADPAEVQNLRGEIAATRAASGIWSGDIPQLIINAQEALANLAPSNLSMRGLTARSLGLAYFGQGNLAAATQMLTEAVANGMAAEHAYLTSIASANLAFVQRAQGALEMAATTCRRAIAWSAARSAESAPALGIVYLGLADLLLEWNELDAAQDHAERAVSLCSEWGFLPFQLYSALVLARTRQAWGALDAAQGVLREARNLAQQRQAAWGVTLLAAPEAQLWLQQGRLSAALHWLAHREATPPRLGLSPFVFVYAYEHWAMAPIQVLLAHGRASGTHTPVDGALTLLEQQRLEAERIDLPWLRIKVLALKALAYQALGKVREATEALQDALALAAPAGYIRVFADEGAPLGALLDRIGVTDTEPGYIQAIRNALSRHPRSI